MPRTPKIPPTISAEARELLRLQSEVPDVPTPHQDDAEGWKALIAAMRAGLIDALAADGESRLNGMHQVVHDVDGVTVHELRPLVENAATAVVVLHLHGGGFALGSGDGTLHMGSMVASGLQLPVYAVDYRVPPENPHPAPLDDCMSAYRWLLESYAAETIVLHGHSAGANLVAALLLRAADEQLPSPRGAVILSPEVDLTEEGDSFEQMGRVDFLTRFIEDYAAGADLTHPYLSPIFGDVSTFPPTLLQTGTRDVFLSNTVRFHRHLRRAGVPAALHVWEAMPHAGFGGAPEDREIDAEVRRFIKALP